MAALTDIFKTIVN